MLTLAGVVYQTSVANLSLVQVVGEGERGRDIPGSDIERLRGGVSKGEKGLRSGLETESRTGEFKSSVRGRRRCWGQSQSRSSSQEIMGLISEPLN